MSYPSDLISHDGDRRRNQPHDKDGSKDGNFRMTAKIISIDGRPIGAGHAPYVIAEIGINHGGDPTVAKELIHAAAKSGADAAKFQTFVPSGFIARSSPYFDIFVKADMGADVLPGIVETARDAKISAFASVFDRECAELWERLDAPAYKIASGDLTHIPMLQNIAEYGKPMIVSTGGATMQEIEDSLTAIYTVNGKTPVALLHCVSNYPTTPGDANLACMATMREAFGVPVGFSDHTLGNATAIAAVALGAEIIEKHFTLDRTTDGPDHALSCDPDGLRELVDGANDAYAAIGSANKAPVEAADFIPQIRRSVTADVAIAGGVVITEQMIAFKRPGTGIAPVDVDKVIGAVSAHEIAEDQTLTWDDIKR